MWIEPICDKHCSLTVDLKDLTLEQLMKINEYRQIRSSVEEFYMEESEKKEEMNNRMNGRR